jgi:protocatechuate 3,4-dioxygenase beta subunit-like protein
MKASKRSAVLQCLKEQIPHREEVVLTQLKLREGSKLLLTVSGIRQILVMTTFIRYTREDAGAQPPNHYPAYASTLKRAPKHAPIRLEQTLSEITGLHFGPESVSAVDADLSRWNGAAALGERIIVTGRVLDCDRAVAEGRTLGEVLRDDPTLRPHLSDATLA